MLLVLLNLSVLLQQSPSTTAHDISEWFQYGIAGVLAFLITLLLKYIMQRDKADQKLALQRSEMYRDDNKKRDDRFIEALKAIDCSGERFVEATNLNIEKFVSLVNKVMEQSNYQTQVLIELKAIASKLPHEFESVKKDINDQLEKLSIHYEIRRRDKSD
jgi:hypothetical protein